MPDTPIERAARALYRTGDFDPHQFGEDQVWPDLVGYVRAVLAAIRDPSEEMKRVGARVVAPIANQGDCGGPAETSTFERDADDVWQAMIDAISLR